MNIAIVLVFPSEEASEEFFDVARKYTIGIDVRRLNEYSRQSELWHALEDHLYNTSDFEVHNGKKYYSASDIRKILDKHRRK